MNEPYRLTKQGIDELQKEHDELVAQRSVIAEHIKTAREFGDLAENAEYSSARQEQERNEARISELDRILQNAKVIKAPRGGQKVQLGSTVKLRNDGKTKQFQVVGTVEADPLNGKISDESPIGQALLGQKVGDKVEIKLPSETAVYKITEIS